MDDTWEQISEGQPLPELVKVPTVMQVFMFSAVTWNRHLIHYDGAFARSQGLEDVAIQRALIGNFLAQLIQAWLSGGGRMRQLEWSVRGSARVGEPMRLGGVVRSRSEDDMGRLVTVDVWARAHHGGIVAPGRAVVELRS